MTRKQLIISLCLEAGEGHLPDEEIIKGWESNHSACCDEPIHHEPGFDIESHIIQAAQGNPAALIKIRTCMGLPIIR